MHRFVNALYIKICLIKLQFALTEPCFVNRQADMIREVVAGSQLFNR